MTRTVAAGVSPNSLRRFRGPWMERQHDRAIESGETGEDSGQPFRLVGVLGPMHGAEVEGTRADVSRLRDSATPYAPARHVAARRPA